MKPTFTLELPIKLPSWNEILGMNHWRRMKFKAELASVFLSALQASERGSWTRIISAQNTPPTYSATLASYLAMKQESRKLKQRNARLKKAKLKK